MTLLQQTNVMPQMAAGLHHADWAGVIHRDLKPTKIMVLRGSGHIVSPIASRDATENGAIARRPQWAIHVVGPDGVDHDHNTMEQHLLGSDSRSPPAKHRILEMYVEHGFEPPDTPVMALHRGRIDLLDLHLARDPDLLTRTFDITDVYPLAPACARAPYTAQGTPVHGTTFLQQ